jgi:hypothetical protein
MWYVARFNSFASGAHDYPHHINRKPQVTQIVERAAMVKALTDLDLNYPDLAKYGNAAAIRGTSAMGDNGSVSERCLAASSVARWETGPLMNVQASYRAYCDRLYHYTNADGSCNAKMR